MEGKMFPHMVFGKINVLNAFIPKIKAHVEI